MSHSLKECFSLLEDPRIERHKRHKLLDIIILTICAVISGAEGWEAIEKFGEAKINWLRKWIDLENGIPSHDCIARVIARLEPTKVTECFTMWTKSVTEITDGEVIAIDGKTARGSFTDNSNKKKLGAIHMVSAWANQAGVSLGQVKTQQKSNEITAIPVLLEMLEIKGCIITIDSMGCQTAIAEKIVAKQGDYALAVKGNQPLLYDAIKDFFTVAQVSNPLCLMQQNEMVDSGHGRVEIRRGYLSTCLDTLPNPERWKGLKSIGMVECERFLKSQGTTTIERRYYISTLTNVDQFSHATRAHWGVENSLHWVLDVTFREDESRIRAGYAPENFNVIRQLSVGLLKREPSKMSIKAKRFKAALNDSFRERIIFAT
jgi:predicted transposase YbfD/YdcC